MDWPTFVTSQCPLKVRWAAWEDPTLVLRGDDWSFGCTSSWRLRLADTLVAGAEDSHASDAVDALKHLSVVRCESDNAGVGDIRLVLSDGHVIEAFVATQLEPWVLRLPVPPIVVPAPSAPNWFAGAD
jgi:hypothetical protein